MVRVGIYGGTFDPIHVGHLAAAEEARLAVGLQRVIFVPAGSPPHKARSVASAADRLEMVRLAVRDNPAFTVSSVEVERPGPSYTVDTVRTLQARAGGDELFLLLGSDTLLDLVSWHQPEELCRLVPFVVLLRPGWPRERIEAWVREQPPLRRPHLQVVEMPGLEIASRDLRRRLEAGQEGRYLLPDPVREYIRRRGLYRSGA